MNPLHNGKGKPAPELGPNCRYASWAAIPAVRRRELTIVGEIHGQRGDTRFWAKTFEYVEEGTFEFKDVIIDLSQYVNGMQLQKAYTYARYLAVSPATSFMFMPFIDAAATDPAAEKGGDS